MFQAVPPPIIKSTQLYIQFQVLSTNTAAEEPPETCRASVKIEINQETLHLVGCNLENVGANFNTFAWHFILCCGQC